MKSTEKAEERVRRTGYNLVFPHTVLVVNKPMPLEAVTQPH